MNRMKILLSAVLVFAATASIAQDFSDPRYAPKRPLFGGHRFIRTRCNAHKT